MAKTKISEFDVDPANNTDINSINIAEGCAPSGINNAIRQLMSDLKEFQTGAGGDPFNGAVNGTVGATTPASGAFTSLSASGAFAANGGATLGDASGDALTINSSAVSIPNGLNFDSNTLVIDATNNRVGVGTASPAAGLHVAGSFRQTGATVPFEWTVNAAGADYLKLNAVGYADNLIVATSAGNVGIGTSSPNAKFEVSASGETTVARISNTGSSSNNRAFLRFVSQSSTFGSGVFQTNGTDASYATSALNMYTFDSQPITFGTSNTERMRIDSSGNLLVGTTSASGSAQLVATASTASYALACWNNATTGNNTIVNFGTEGTFTQRGSITYNRGAGLIAYNVTSDYRAKEIISPVLNSGEIIDSVPVYMGKMKDATQARPMFIAHETPDYAHTGEKDAVDEDGNPIYQQMDASSLVPVLWAEIQSLRKRVALLESK